MDAQHRQGTREHQGIPEAPQSRCSAAGPLLAQPGGKLPTTTTFCRRGMCLVLLGNCATLHPSVLGAHAVRAVLQKEVGMSRSSATFEFSTSVTNFGRKKNEFAGHELNDTLNCALEGGLPHVLAWAIDAAEIGKPKASGMPWTAL